MGNNNRRIKILPNVSYTPKQIREIRHRVGLTQQSFAEYMGVSRTSVEAWESGKFHPSGTARRLLSFLDADPSIPYTSGVIQN